MCRIETRQSCLLVIASLLVWCGSVFGLTPLQSEPGPWSLLVYRGNTAKEIFFDVMCGKYSSFGEEIYAAEVAYILSSNNEFKKIFEPIFEVIQVAGNVAYRHDYTKNDNVTEGNLYLIWRFSQFPWKKKLKTSIAIGDGISYATHSPYADREPNRPAQEFSRFLNYLMLELTVALPKYPHWEMVLRMHHRCTAWGVFPGNANAGSTNIGVGIRYYF